MKTLKLLGIVLLVASRPFSLRADETVYDVVVYGGTSAGVVAAVQVSLEGRTVVLIEPGRHLGGLTSGGLGWTDSGDKRTIGGLSRQFYQRIKRHYDNESAWKFQKPQDYDRYRPSEDAMWTFEPHVAEAVYDEMLAERKLRVVKNQRLERSRGVEKQGQRIVSITMESGETYRGRMFIDATYEGDLLAAAGVSYAVGRESNEQYGETLNGVEVRYNKHMHRFVVNVDPYAVPGDPSSGLLPGVHGDAPGEDGQADHRIQAYCFRMCMSNVARNRVPFPKPDGYDEKRYELLLRNFEAGDLRIPMKPDMMPNGKTDTNNNCAFSTDNIGMNYRYPDASYDEREAILREHETYQKGLMWTLANHPRVPEKVRAWMSVWGLAKDEFTDNGNWPHQIYIREARRLISDYVMTELDCRRVRVCEDSVGLGSYNMDSHNCQRYVTADGFVQNEGDVQESPGGPYLVSYRSIVPKRGECENLLAPVCVASTHISYGSIRMEPVFMVLGQSAATAAVLTLKNETAVQDVPYPKLREKLLADGQVLDLPEPIGPKIVIRRDSLKGVVLDDTDAELTGKWLHSGTIQPYLERGYIHDNNEDKGEKSVRFKANLDPGVYEIRVAYSANPNRATNVSVTVRMGEEVRRFRLNQQKPPDIDRLFTAIRRLHCAGTTVVEISTDETDGFVVVDAVQFLPVSPSTKAR